MRGPQIGAVLLKQTGAGYVGSAAFLRKLELSQKPSQPGILFKQRVHVVAVFVIPKRRFVASKGTLK
jgi:hypothetical protein